MSRVALNTLKNKLIIVPAIIFIVGAGVGIWSHGVNPYHVQTVNNAQHQTTQISYQGQNGKDALSLLKAHATVVAKHYSFGDLVTSINGSTGNGPKYWTFYINGKESMVGASAYMTKSSDTLSWKLQ